MPRRGGDWSGLSGHCCEVCGRSSENVGPRRGFDYINDYCGGCCDLSSDDDGHTEEGFCRSCKKYITFQSAFDSYCGNCVKYCQLCGRNEYDDVIHPKDADKYKVPLDAAIVEIIDMEDYAVARLGEDAKHGEVVYLCKKCHNHKWKRHPKRGEHFPGFTPEEIKNAL